MIGEQFPPKYRHEYKYLCDARQNAVLKSRVRGIMKQDVNSGSDGAYRIRSLYFDSLQNSCYYDNEDGVDIRDKYRIRIYNADSSYIILEKKSKKQGMTLKQMCPIDEMLCRQMMEGTIRIRADMPEKLKRLLLEIQEKCMRPVVIVEYLRYPFVEKNGNVRITFDEHITSSNDISGFLSPHIIARPILEKGMGILEVKWDEFLPGYIKDFIQLDSLQWSSFSKYYLCRKYNTCGGIKV